MSSDPYEYLDRDERRDLKDSHIGDDTGWDVDTYDPDDREPMGGDPLWAEELWD